MEVRIKKLHPGAVIPKYAHDSDAGMDLVAVSKSMDENGNVVYGTGLAMEIPKGYVGLLFPRSSNCRKTLWLTNHVGVIDSGYRGEIMLKYRTSMLAFPYLENKIRTLLRKQYKVNLVRSDEYHVGDRVGQLIIIPYPKIEFKESDFLFPSDRGVSGYGSTGE